MIPNKLRYFIDQLQKATEEDIVTWNSGAEKSFFCNHKDSELHIWKIFDPDIELSYFEFQMSIKGKKTSFKVTEEYKDYEVMRILFEAISVNANRVEDELKDFFT